MRFPLPKRYREMLTHPFRPRNCHAALTDVSLEVEPGARIAVMGPNGAGKTTLLKLIGGLLLPTEGDVVVNGLNTRHHDASARRSVGFVLNEERSFFWRLTAVENLRFFGTLDNLTGKDLDRRIRELIALVGLGNAADIPVGGFSSGMKQRLALARGLIAEPDVLILDEPTRTLDPIACDETIELLISRICREPRKTLLIATHRLEEASRLCNQVAVIDHGRLQTFNTLAEIGAEGMTLAQLYRRSVRKEQHARAE